MDPSPTATAARGSGTEPLPKVVQGGEMGMVDPTLQSISGVLWNDENNNGIQT